MSSAFPMGWNEDRVREVLDHYESQSEDEQFAEIEAALEQEDTITLPIPANLAPEVWALIARSSDHYVPTSAQGRAPIGQPPLTRAARQPTRGCA